MYNDDTAKEIVSLLFPINHEYFDLGLQIGKLYSDFGLPIDIALEKIDGDKRKKAQVLFGAQQWLIEHRRNSNATDKAIERQRKSNLEAMRSFIRTGESGIY